ncbi:hypothetical protein MTR_1g056260 [Medicago truncatula]|uniref:Retrovirus-related Pol polyprotein from transposon TNT 1-94 n=1 Tax=Medicago truncatula TaxID=3880 RepID=G7I801_MEDTR|nr:hypothetical protein MTR_1g056260 [Medicago truncatula]
MVEDDVQIGIGVSRKVSTIEKEFEVFLGVMVPDVGLLEMNLDGNFLRSKEYWSLVDDGVARLGSGGPLTAAEQKTPYEMMLKYLKVKNYLLHAIDRKIIETILEKNTLKKIWASMRGKDKGYKSI